MDRTTWTDERLDDLSGRMDAGFDRVERNFERVDRRFEQVDRRFERVDQDIRDLRVEMRRGFEAVDGRFDAMHATMVRFGGAMIVCLLGAIAAFSLGGA